VSQTPGPDRRRPVTARSTPWAQGTARFLAQIGVTPNAISIASIVFTALSAWVLFLGVSASGIERIALCFTAAALIEMRLFANLLDGLVAVEGKRGSPTGEIWNELPDRFSDVITLTAAGYAAGVWGLSGALGWLAGSLAVITAYVRALGSSIGTSAQFLGPMAKQRRMETIALGCVLTGLEPFWNGNGQALALAISLVAIGSAVTIARRVLAISAEVRHRPRA
jgi:phosphatidylglycerophosphate synthase